MKERRTGIPWFQKAENTDMTLKKTCHRGMPVAEIYSEEPLITDTASALDLMATVKAETGCDRFVINKEAVAEDFFRLSTCLAGEILQKYINYHMKLAIYGEYSGYTSKPLKDFLYESNQGKDVFFVSSLEEGLDRLAGAGNG